MAQVLHSALELRFQVYCIECNFLSPQDYPSGMESDEHDASATHFYAFDADEDLVGYVRLIRPDAQGRFPLHRHCDVSHVERLPASSSAVEISRLMVRADYRRRRGDRLSGVTAEQSRAAFAGERRSEAPQILLSLYRQMFAYCSEKGIRHWYAAMERPLARSLLRYKFGFRPIGPEADYYGPVAPYLADLRELELQVSAHHPALMQWMRRPQCDDAVDCTEQRWSRYHMRGAHAVPPVAGFMSEMDGPKSITPPHGVDALQRLSLAA
ncbi:MAG: PEP-CTERM/exosortase system-associated acyltransferase [Burkholderiaceae bacterium]|nr:PEP-CTERM/exosortase system-associated acyltransferase [Burkholderiaceae bacterium]